MRYVTLIPPENVDFCPRDLVQKLPGKHAVQNTRSASTRQNKGKGAIRFHEFIDCSNHPLAGSKAEFVHINKYPQIRFYAHSDSHLGSRKNKTRILTSLNYSCI